MANKLTRAHIEKVRKAVHVSASKTLQAAKLGVAGDPPPVTTTTVQPMDIGPPGLGKPVNPKVYVFVTVVVV